jgi:hypothetical protein
LAVRNAGSIDSAPPAMRRRRRRRRRRSCVKVSHTPAKMGDEGPCV